MTGGQLFGVLKSACGVTEAPRFWYLKACKLPAETPLKELDIAKAMFTAWDERGTWAILCLRVDDGLVGSKFHHEIEVAGPTSDAPPPMRSAGWRSGSQEPHTATSKMPRRLTSS